MPTETVSNAQAVAFDWSQLSYLAPEIVLAVWGLVVLIVDISVLRKRTGDVRRDWLARVSLVGAGLAVAACVVSLIPGWMGINPFQDDRTLFSGTLAGDAATIWMNLALAGMLALVIAVSAAWNFTEHWGEYYALLLWAAVGMMLLVAAEELLTLFLSLEMMTICLYLLASLEKSRRRSAEAGLKYFVYGSVSSALFLFGLSLVYGLTGTTRLEAVRQALLSASYQGGMGLEGNVAGATAVLLILVGFGFKVAAVPFHQWAPDTYEGAPAPVTAWVASGSKLASFVALMKVLIFGLGPWATDPSKVTTPGWVGLLALIAAVSMTYGNFAALAQRNFKRMLAYSSVAHAGYILVGVLAVAISRDGALAAGSVMFYIVTYGFATVGAFAVAAWLARDLGTEEIEDLNGLGSRAPLLAVCIVLLMLSLIGMPPLAGFWGKLYVFMQAMNAPERGRISLTWLVALGLFNSVVSAFYYVRVLKAMFLRPPSSQPTRAVPSGVAWSIVVATAVTVGFGIRPEILLMPMDAAASPMLFSATDRRNATEQVTDPVERERRLRDEVERRRKQLEEAGRREPQAKGVPTPKR
jgi:NADH-quinone oxidoreductase subunit N